jgi:hypothetical protein
VTFTGMRDSGLGFVDRLCPFEMNWVADGGATGRQRIGTNRATRKENVRVEAPAGVAHRMLDEGIRSRVGPASAMGTA